MRAEARTLVPADKHDLAAVQRALDAGFPAVEPVLAELLDWIQDLNWPVARPLLPLLASIGKPIIPHIQAVLDGHDDIWKRSCLDVVARLPADAQQLLIPPLERLAHSPSSGERDQEVDEKARELLQQLEPRTV